MYSVLKNSRIGTPEHELFEKIVKNESYNVKVADMGRQEEIFQLGTGLLRDVVTGKIVIIENSNIVTMSFTYGACYVHPELVERIKPSREVFAQSMMSSFVIKRDTS